MYELISEPELSPAEVPEAEFVVSPGTGEILPRKAVVAAIQDHLRDIELFC